MTKIISSLILIILAVSGLFARDIDLDKIYLKSNSRSYKKLIHYKVEAYKKLSSVLIDSNIIFSFWVNGNEIIYIKEFPGINIIYIYQRIQKRRLEISRLKGTITSVLISPNGRYLFIKRLNSINNDLVSEIVFLNIKTRFIKVKKSYYPFIDFSTSPEGDSVLYENSKGIVELYPESNIKKLICKRSSFSDIISSSAVTIAHLSPNRKRILLSNGSGGAYRSKIITGKRSWNFNRINSSSEIYWINNRHIAYRKGYPGNFSIYIYNTNTGKQKRLIKNSLNTNMIYSKHPEIISFLKDQIIHYYDIKKEEIINTGIEGEDVTFSPDGNQFISLLFKNLFITNKHIIQKRNMRIKKNSRHILILYKKLLARKRHWTNNYSPTYIRKKIRIYKKLVGND